MVNDNTQKLTSRLDLLSFAGATGFSLAGMAHIILLEDERILREDLTEFLSSLGHSVQAVGSIAEFERDFDPGRHLIAILDLGLPDGDGMDVIARLRRDNLRLGIIVLTARISIQAKVAGLQSGADHYLTKTTDMDILAATVDSLARRLDLGGVSGDWVLDAAMKHLIAPGLPPIELSAQDYTVLRAIFDGQGKSVSKKTIVAALGDDFLTYDLRRLDTQINRLRRKVVEATGTDLPLKTLRNEGYQFCGAVAHR